MTAAPLRLDSLEDRLTPVSLPAGVGIETVLDVPALVTALDVANDGRLFLAEKDIGVRVVRDGVLLPEPFVRLSLQTFAEQGTMGVVLDPRFSENNFVYVYYTHFSPDGVSVNRVSRFTADGDAARPGSEVVIWQMNRVSTTNHIGGALHFGADGKLYIAVGDHNDPAASQSLTTLAGKLLRLNPDGVIPSDNPFVGRTSGPYQAIWALGLRNPYTFAVGPQTGRMFINDVGGSKFEELNAARAGANYGWPRYEGFAGAAGFADPLYAYPHGQGNDAGYAITAGTFYETPTPALPEQYAGRYFFGDLTNLYLKTYDPNTRQVELFATGLPDSPLDLDVDGSGNLLLLAAATGPVTGQGGAHSTRLYRIRSGGSAAPTILSQPADLFASTSGPATFRVGASGEGLSYQWQRDGFDIPGATGPELTLTGLTLADSGASFRILLRNAVGSAVSRAATLTLTDDKPPTVSIGLPEAGATFAAGDTVSFAGGGTDPEGGDLPAEALSWRVEYHTGRVSRPLAGGIGGAFGSVVIPSSTPYKGTDVFIRLVLTGRDAAGLEATATVDLLPRLGTFTLASDLQGVLSLDGTPVASGAETEGVAGVERQLSARPTLRSAGRRYEFAGWSDGVAERERVIRTPDGAATFTALYRDLGPAPLPGLALGYVGGAELRRADGSTLAVAPFPGFTGQYRAAAEDTNGDGVTDLVVTAGPGGAPLVVVLDGASGVELARFWAFEASFRGGVYLAVADLDGDGRAEIVASPDLGGGPVVAVFDGTGLERRRFFGVDDPAFRGGARVALGDLSGDGTPDLLVSAGFGGGPRLAGYDGATLFADGPRKLFADYLAFEPSLRNGAFVAAGDLDGDGVADIVAGGGPGGAPRVRVYSGAALTQARAEVAPLADFFAGDPRARGGVSVASRDVTEDGRDELVTGVDGVVTAYALTPEPALARALASRPGVFVG